jgi:hypothetical protein
MQHRTPTAKAMSDYDFARGQIYALDQLRNALGDMRIRSDDKLSFTYDANKLYEYLTRELEFSERNRNHAAVSVTENVRLGEPK